MTSSAALFIWSFAELRTHNLSRGRRELERVVAERTEQLKMQNTALVKARAALKVQATHDSLTALWNRRAILEQLDHEFRRALRQDSILSVILADLDHFKAVNDSHGHLCGDRVLREAAARLGACLRGYDVIGRYGGEEFLILMPGWDPASNPTRVHDLLASINSQAVPALRNPTSTSPAASASPFSAVAARLHHGRSNRLRRSRPLSRQNQRPQPHPRLRNDLGIAGLLNKWQDPQCIRCCSGFSFCHSRSRFCCCSCFSFCHSRRNRCELPAVVFSFHLFLFFFLVIPEGNLLCSRSPRAHPLRASGLPSLIDLPTQ